MSVINVWYLRGMVRATRIGFTAMQTNYFSTNEDSVLFEVKNKTGVITLNRAKTLNALDLDMVRTMHPVLKAWDVDPNIGGIVMKGAGEKAFCAGGDVKSIALGGQQCQLSKDFFKEEYQLNFEIGNLKTPYIALINGITMGGGVGLSVHGKYRIASEKTLFAMPETAIGLFPDVGGGYFLPRLKGNLGLYLALTGHRLKSRDVFFAGVATHFVDNKEVPYLEEEICSLDNHEAELEKLLDNYHNKSDDYNAHFSLKDKTDIIDRTFCGETLEEIFEALEKENSEWSNKQLETLRKMSPVSMKATVRQLKEGANMSLGEVLQMEYRISQACMSNGDFFEGIRALLIDRDNSPRWEHDSIDKVSEETINAYFKPLPADRELVFN